MIDKKFLEELGLSEEVIEQILERLKEGEEKGSFEKLLKYEIEKLNPQDIKVVLKLFDTEGIEDEAVLIERLLEFKEEYPFLFKKGNMPQLAGSTKAVKGVTVSEFKKMGYKERSELYQKNPKLYKQLTNA